MAMTAQRPEFEVRKAHPHVGAEVLGVDLRERLEDEIFEAVRDAFHQHSILVFRDQDITDEQQVEFSARFGELEPTSFSIASKHPYVYSLSNVDENGQLLHPDADKRRFLLANARWHTDSSFRAIPAMASLLSGREVPRNGGDTQFASMRVGYETLPEDMLRRVEGLSGSHSYAYTLSHYGRHDKAAVSQDEIETVPPVVHPLVRIHAPTGRKSLFVSGHIESIVGMPAEEGRALVRQLIDWCTRPDYVYTHKWRRHDLVMWDNRCALHRATVIPTDERRIMHRTTIAGEVPEG